MSVHICEYVHLCEYASVSVCASVSAHMHVGFYQISHSRTHFSCYISPFSKHILKDVSYAKFQVAMLLNYPDLGSDELNIVSIFPS